MPSLQSTPHESQPSSCRQQLQLQNGYKSRCQATCLCFIPCCDTPIAVTPKPKNSTKLAWLGFSTSAGATTSADVVCLPNENRAHQGTSALAKASARSRRPGGRVLEGSNTIDWAANAACQLEVLGHCRQ